MPSKLQFVKVEVSVYVNIFWHWIHGYVVQVSCVSKVTVPLFWHVLPIFSFNFCFCACFVLLFFEMY